MLTSSNFMSRQAWVYMAVAPGPLGSLNLYVSRSILMFVIRMFTDARLYTYVVVEHDTDLCARDLRMCVHKPVMFLMSTPFRLL